MLVVEDNPINREVAVELLRLVGLVVETAEDGARALEMTRSRSYDLVLMDMQMPQLDGLEATRALRARDGLALPIIAMTANAFGEDRASCLEAGMNDHVAKPVDPSQLHAALLRWLPLPANGLVDGASAQDQEEAEAARLVPRLQALPGFDVAVGLRHVGARPAVLVRALRRFVRAYEAGLPALAVLAPGWPAGVHSLRGACATVGAVDLHQALQRFEAEQASLPDPAARGVRAQALQAQLLALVGALRQALEERPAER